MRPVMHQGCRIDAVESPYWPRFPWSCRDRAASVRIGIGAPGTRPRRLRSAKREVNTMSDTTQPGVEADEEIVALENAALLTQGGSSSSVENKRSPYGY
ncbi:albusnodin family lasso peptide [Streptomyces qinzhouensis]|uniref:Albusnodin family lasso peptide n=1 Tax=Streptomyces qinzhouensis TaxID=2599401 RepID=A0A5B8J9L9_9ACTN|nr:albusnodin family lasso peptide [Streptomyces qinzhouensis]